MRNHSFLTWLFIFFSSQVSPSLSAPNSDPSCSPDLWTQPTDTGGAGVKALLKDVPLGTRWVDLPATIKTQLKVHADNRLAAFRARWAADALVKKETILLGCATSEMTAAIDEYYRRSYDTIVPGAFSLREINSAALTRALIRKYLGSIAAYRATLTYPLSMRVWLWSSETSTT
jgi:hypothetical protein